MCPNLNNPQVKQEFEELVNAVGEVAAYDIWSKNNGNAIDKAPNGAESQLFNELLKRANGDRNLAIKLKSRFFTKSFMSQYGDWVKDPKNVSRIKLDENGEVRLDSLTTDPTKLSALEVHGMSTKDIISRLRYSVPRNHIAHSILNLFSKLDIKVRLMTDLDFQEDPDLKDAHMAYGYDINQDDIILINADEFDDVSDLSNLAALLHEIVHVYTQRSLKAVSLGKGTQLEIKLYNKITELWNKYREMYHMQADEKGRYHGDFYGLNSQSEFIAELLTNQRFLENLIEDARQNNLLENVLQMLHSIWNAIYELFTGEHIIKIDKEVENAQELLLQLLSFNVEDQNQDATFRIQDSIRERKKYLKKAVDDMSRYHFDTEKEMNERLNRIRQSITEGLKARLKTIDFKDIAKRAEVIENIKYQLANLENDLISNIQIVQMFITETKFDALEVGEKVMKAYKGETGVFTDQELVDLNKNYFGFYVPQITEIFNSLANLDSYREIIGKEDYDTLMHQLQLCKTTMDLSYDAVKRMQVVNAQRALVQHGVKVGDQTIFNYVNEYSRTTDFDINVITRMIGAGDKIKDQAIKTLFSITQEVENEINSVVFTKSIELNKLLKVVGNTKQKLLFEVDEKGRPTGYIIRDKNYGAFFNDLKAFKEKLYIDFGLNSNQLMLPENYATRVEFNRRLNDWINLRCERKYTPKFYELLNSLSPETFRAKEAIESKIRTLTNKYRDYNGLPHYEKMKQEEWEQLESYEFEKKQLASIYDQFGNEKLKGSIERTIADELTAYNKELQKNIKHKDNQEKFAKLLEKKEQELSAKEFKLWKERNTRVIYDEKFYAELESIERADYGNQYTELSAKKRELLNMFRNSRTGEVDANAMPLKTKRVIEDIDRKLRAIKQANKNKVKKSTTGVKFQDVAVMRPSKLYYKDESRAADEDIEVSGTLEVFYMDNTYETSKGSVPKAWYMKIVPKNTDYIHIVPSASLAELSEESPFLNKNYDITNDEYYQPKKSFIDENGNKVTKYDNSKEFNRIMNMKGMKELRQALIDTMKESNDKLNNLEYLNKYLLPQITGSWVRYIRANGFLSGTLNWLLDKFTVLGDDEGIKSKVQHAPDGTSLSLVPQYFTKRLRNPAVISANLVGNVISYYRMAENFKRKNEIRGTVENILHFLAQRDYKGSNSLLNRQLRRIRRSSEDKKGTETNLYKFAQKFVSMNIYDTKLTPWSITIGEREISVSKILRNFLGLGTLINLGLNFICAATGFFTALHNHLMTTFVGRYYTWHNALAAFKDVVYDAFKYGLAAGSINYKSQQMAYMDYFEVGGTSRSLSEHTNWTRLQRLVSGHWAFGIYSMSDYFIKGQILNCVMYDYKLIDGEFIHHEAYFNRYGKTDETKRIWDNAETFKSSTEISAGKIKAKDARNQKAVDAAKYHIGDTARALSASADGQLTPLQKAQITTNVLGAMVMMHRNYLPTLMQNTYSMDRQYDYQSQREVEALLKTPITVFQRIWRDNSGLAIASELLKTILFEKNLSSSVEKYNLRRLKLDILTVGIIYPILRDMIRQSADDDKKDWWKNALALIASKTTFENGAPYNLVDVYNTIKSPTPLFSLLGNVGTEVAYPFYLATSILLNQQLEENEIIKRGPYKNMRKIQRVLWKTTPFKNIIELKDVASKRRYYETQILGLN